MPKANIIKLIQPGNVDDQLTEILRTGARALLAQAVEAEVADFLGRHVNVKNESGRISALPHFSGFTPCAIISSRADQVEELTIETGAYTKGWESSPISVLVTTAQPQVP